MGWVYTLVGAFCGALISGASDGSGGLVFGALIGGLFASVSKLKTRIAVLEATAAAVPAASFLARTEVVAATAPATSVPTYEGPDARIEPRVVAATPPLESPQEASTASARVPNDAVIAEPLPEPQFSNAPLPTPAPEPGWFERAVDSIKHWFSDGNVPVKIGMLVLFVGVASLLNYAVDQGMLVLPVELWFALVAAIALGGLWFGWRQRDTRRAFGLSLQGGALGVLLLTVFAAYRFYHLLPAGAALAMVVLLVAGSALLAVLQNTMALAVLGFIGGFLAPVLIATGSGNHVALFTYYAVLNAAVFAVAWVRQWRVLNLVGFGFTFVVGTLWGYRYYTPAHFGTVEPFLILFFLFYVGIGVLYVVRSQESKRPFVDGTLTFGTPLLAVPLQAALLRGNDLAMAFSALAVAALYAGLFAWLRRREGVRVQAEAFAGLALVFATLAVPLALSAQWTASTWALEGAALVWLGLREERRLPQLAGLALQALAGVSLVFGLLDHGYQTLPGDLPVFNGHCLGASMLALAAYFSSWQYDRHPSRTSLAGSVFLWGSLWWAVAGLREIEVYVIDGHAATAVVGFTGFTILVAAMLRGALQWPRLGVMMIIGVVLGLPLAMATHYANGGPFAQRGWVAWAPFLLVMLFALGRLRDPLQRGVSLAHVAALFLVPLLVALQLREHAERASLADGWRFMLTMAPLFAMFVATWRVPRVLAWPLADLFPIYRVRWFLPAAAVLLVGWMLSLDEPGAATPLPFVPLLNPLELAQALILLGVWLVARDRTMALEESGRRALRNALLLASFVTLTFATLRALHQSTGAAWNTSMLDSMLAQTSLTVVWSIVGVGAWIAGSRRGSRPLWLAGAVLMAFVLAKLVLVDREHVGNIPGIVSFIAVGLLLTVVGYFAPSPPRDKPMESPA